MATAVCGIAGRAAPLDRNMEQSQSHRRTVAANFAFRILLAARKRPWGGWSRQEKRRKTHRAFLSATGVVGADGVLGVIPEGMVDNGSDHESIRRRCGG